MEEEKAPAIPTWVKTLGIIAIVLVLLMVGAHLMGMGGANMHNMHQPSVEVTAQS